MEKVTIPSELQLARDKAREDFRDSAFPIPEGDGLSRRIVKKFANQKKRVLQAQAQGTNVTWLRSKK